MAVYLWFDQLETLSQFGNEGQGVLTIEKLDPHILVKGSVTGEVPLMPGQKVGFENGRVWLAGGFYDDPIRNLFSTMSLSRKIIVEDEDIEYDPLQHDRFVAGAFTESEGFAGMRVVHGGDAVAVIERGSRLPPYIDAVAVRLQSKEERADLIPWLREALMSRGYLTEHGRRIDNAFYMARSICFKSGIVWDSPHLMQNGRSFIAADGSLYTLHAYRRSNSEECDFTPDRHWIPHITHICPDYNDRHVCIADALMYGLILEWATALECIEICNLCGAPLNRPSDEVINCSAGCF